MDFFSIRNWDKLQHYTDRTPPWIKLYNHLLDDYDFSCLQDASKLQLMLIWLLASRNNNRLPLNAKWIKQRIGVDADVDLDALIEGGHIILLPNENNTLQTAEHDASMMLASCKQVATTEREREGENKKNPSSPAAPDIVNEIFEYWRDNTGRTKGTKKLPKRLAIIKSRLKEGYTPDEIKQAVDGCMASAWNTGDNPSGKKYTNLALICRDGEKLEEFRDAATAVPKKTNGSALPFGAGAI